MWIVRPRTASFCSFDKPALSFGSLSGFLTLESRPRSGLVTFLRSFRLLVNILKALLSS